MGHQILIEPIFLGKIGACYGIRGWLKIFSSTEEVENIFNYQPWFIQRNNKWEKIEIENWRYHKKKVIGKLKDINSYDEANLLVNSDIVIDASQLPVLKEGDYYWKDLIGCHVFTILGYYLGIVVNIIETRSNDVLVIQKDLKGTSSKKEYLIPFLDRIIINKIDLNTRIIKVDWNAKS